MDGLRTGCGCRGRKQSWSERKGIGWPQVALLYRHGPRGGLRGCGSFYLLSSDAIRVEVRNGSLNLSAASRPSNSSAISAFSPAPASSASASSEFIFDNKSVALLLRPRRGRGDHGREQGHRDQQNDQQVLRVHLASCSCNSGSQLGVKVASLPPGSSPNSLLLGSESRQVRNLASWIEDWLALL